jgi:hypothetical protein
VALATPKPSTAESRPVTPRLTRADVVKLFEPFNQSVAQIETNYIEKREDRDLYSAASSALRRAYPPAQQVSSAGQPELRSTANDNGKGDLNSVYETALAITSRSCRTSRTTSRKPASPWARPR